MIKLNNLVDEIFYVGEVETFSEKISRDYSDIKENILDALNNEKDGKLNDWIEVYLGIIEEFLENLDGFNSQELLNEKRTPFGGFIDIKIFSQNLEKIYKVAINKNDKDVLRKMFTQRQWANMVPLLQEIGGETAEFVKEMTTGKSAAEGFETQMEALNNQIKLLQGNLENAKGKF